MRNTTELQNTTCRRYVLDTLYGVIYFPDYIWDVLFIPEMQRLRELRLYNINSLCFTGGANINRYEHALGTCYLALKCVQSHPGSIPIKEQQLIILAALFHDLYNAAFGHSLEYIEDFSPADMFYSAIMGHHYDSYQYKHASFEPIYFGMCGALTRTLLDRLQLIESDIAKIGAYIRGEDEYGVLINGSMDLDNIDNVYRMSYHMGLTTDTRTPLLLAQSIWAHDRKLFIEDDALPLVDQWITLRKRLYKFLLLNPDDFSAKYMLTEALEQSKVDDKHPFAWYDTDFQLMEKLSKSSSAVSNIVSRLMTGSVYGCFGIYSTSNTEIFKTLSNPAARGSLENELTRTLRPEVTMRVSDFSVADQKSIKGIRGISYDNNTLILKMTHDIKKETMNSLLNVPLLRHRQMIREMHLNLRNKFFAFKLRSPVLGLHSILDVNRTERQVTLNLNSGKVIVLGRSSCRLFIGVFIKNKEFANFNLDDNTVLVANTVLNIKGEIRNFFIRAFGNEDIQEIPLYSEVEYA